MRTFIKILLIAALFGVAVLDGLAQVRLGVRLVTGGGASDGLPTLSYLGAFRPSIGTNRGGVAGTMFLAGRRASGVNRLFLSQGDPGAHVYYGAPVEFTDPVSAGTAGDYSSSSTVSDLPAGTTVTNWRFDTGVSTGSNYDFWDLAGVMGTTYNSAGAEVHVGNPGVGYLIHGLIYHDDGSGTCCLYATWGAPYGVYPNPSTASTKMHWWNMVGADLVTPGAVERFGPIRVCSGTYGGSEQCGLSRATFGWTMPDGKFGHGSSNNNTQQGFGQHGNAGPSFFVTDTWPAKDGDYSFGSTRSGNAVYRTTDFTSTSYLAHYYLDAINDAGQVTTGLPLKSARRPKLPSGTSPPSYGGVACEEGDGYHAYCYEGKCTGSSVTNSSQEPSPQEYDGVGGWTSNDSFLGGAYVSINGQEAFVALVSMCTGHVWYRTTADTTCQRTAAEISAGGGPLACPAHELAENSVVAVTGPVCSKKEVALWIYDPADLQAVPDYSPDPVQIIYLAREWNLPFWYDDPDDSQHIKMLQGVWYEPTEQKIYFGVWGGDVNVSHFGEKRPVVYVAGVSETPGRPRPVPSPLLPLGALLAIPVVGRLTRRARVDAAPRDVVS